MASLVYSHQFSWPAKWAGESRPKRTRRAKSFDRRKWWRRALPFRPRRINSCLFDGIIGTSEALGNACWLT